jgi:hypothetical protein
MSELLIANILQFFCAIDITQLTKIN